MAGGAGRGNKGVTVVEDDNRPECPQCSGFMKSNGSREWMCTECGKRLNKTTAIKHLEEEEFNRWGYDTDLAEANAARIQSLFAKGKRKFVITSAQNNTGVFNAFWQSLQTYCKHNGAELLVVPSHYKNNDAWTRDDEKYWVSEVQPHLIHGDVELGHLLIRASVKIPATTIWPLNGKQAHGGDKWVVFGHPQNAMEPVPTPGGLMPKRLYTTASCSKRNYSVSDQGEKAKFHHVFGALVVEFGDSEYPFIRQINAGGNGAFYDLDKRYTTKGVTKGHSIEALVPGDEHVKFNKARHATYDSRYSLVKLLKPKFIVRHDVLDGYAGSHHHEKDPLTQFKKHHSGDNCYRSELEECIAFINETTPKGVTSLIVHSNHHDHLDKWLNRADPHKDHHNAQLILEMMHLQREAALTGADTHAMRLYFEPRLSCKHKWLSRSEPFMIADVDQSQHGDVGVNGSRGSARALAKSTFKMNIGHSHGARIVQGVYQSGVSTGRLEYEKGLGDHSITHIVQYKDGKRTLVDIIDDRWKL